LEGDSGNVTHQNSVAETTVFHRSTVTIFHALAINCLTGADPIRAMVAQGANHAIIAITPHWLILTPTLFGADVVGAGILVIAHHRVPNADTCNAVIGHRAGVAIQTLALVQSRIFATHIAHATIYGAAVAVIAEVNVAPIDFSGLVYVTVTIIVETIAEFFGRYRRIAVGEPVSRTGPKPGARAPIIGHFTGRGQS